MLRNDTTALKDLQSRYCVHISIRLDSNSFSELSDNFFLRNEHFLHYLALQSLFNAESCLTRLCP